jgi:hypothetical protein
MRKIGLVSAAVIAMAMAAMAGAVAASAPPVNQATIEFWMLEMGGEIDARTAILDAVSDAERNGLSGEAAQQRITSFVQEHLRSVPQGLNIQGLPGEALGFLALGRAHRSLINDNQLRRGSDGDLAVSAMLAAREPDRSQANRGGGGYRGGSRGSYGGGTRGGGGGSWTAGDAGRNVPGNAAAGRPATDAATTEVQQSQTTDDPDLDDEAGEPD